MVKRIEDMSAADIAATFQELVKVQYAPHASAQPALAGAQASIQVTIKGADGEPEIIELPRDQGDTAPPPSET